MLKTTLSIRTACERADIGRTTIYKLLQEGRFQSSKIGRRRRIAEASFCNVFGGNQ